ncbi:MAG: transcription termination/antitermination protein NusG [Eubacteriales bacterium]|nr:transcription termination/antitermination protein NusG [Eubacteriales bacterium]
MSEAKWYVVHTYSGYENKVKETIESRKLDDQILEVLVPLEKVVELRNGVEKEVTKKMFPGYVLLHMIMNDDTWYVVRNTRGVTGFVGPGSKPVPLTEEEIKAMGINLDSEDSMGNTDNLHIDFKEGDTVMITSGSMSNTTGTVVSLNMQKRVATINIELFNRETAVEISFAEIQKV